MKKIILLMFIFTGFAFGDIAFLTNQKYACINRGVFQGENLVEIMSIDDAKKNPLRFYVDDNNLLHMENDSNLSYVGNKTYMNDDFIIYLAIVDKAKAIYLVTQKPDKFTYLYVCVETNNWTIK